MKLVKHVRRWNVWRKKCLNSPLHKFLVLIGLVKSPTMMWAFLPEELEEFKKALEDAIGEARK